MKYTYFSSTKSGKYLIRSQFWYNRRSCAFLSQSNPLWCVLSRPVDFVDKLEWYWCDKENNLQTHNHFLDITDKLLSLHYSEYWYPIKDYRGYNYLPIDNWVTHENFWKCLENFGKLKRLSL